MAARRKIAITLAGQPITGLKSAVGESVDWYLTLVDPNTLLPIDLRGLAVVMALCELDLRGNPIQPPIISRQADNLTQFGTCHVPWAATDTAPITNPPTPPVQPGYKGIDVWLLDPTSPDPTDRLQEYSFTTFLLTPAGVLPNTLIVPLPAQLPLGQGPPGPFPAVPSNVGTFIAVVWNGVLRSQQQEQIKVHFDGSGLGSVDVRLADHNVNFGNRPYYFAGYMVQTDDHEAFPIQVTATPPGNPFDFTVYAPAPFIGDVMITLREVLT